MCLQNSRYSVKPNLNFLNFNVEGLASGLEEPDLLKLINQHDICVFSETWKKDESKIELPGWWDFSLVRPKYKKSGRYSGGITIFCRNQLRHGIKIVQSSEGFVWFKLDASLFNLINDIYVCAVYIPPQRTANLYCKKVDYFQCLYDGLLKYKDKGNIIIAGDFNAILTPPC
jgi:exonuclease III